MLSSKQKIDTKGVKSEISHLSSYEEQPGKLSNIKIEFAPKKLSFIRRINPFFKSKSQSFKLNNDFVNEKFTDKGELTSVEALKQFWNEQIKTAKSTKVSNRNYSSFKLFSQSSDSVNDHKKCLALDGKLPTDEFNKFKNADFVRYKKGRIKSLPGFTSNSSEHTCKINSSNFPQTSSVGGKIHWVKRQDTFSNNKESPTERSETKPTINQVPERTEIKSDTALATEKNMRRDDHGMEENSISKPHGSTSLQTTNSTNRKFSFKTTPSTTSSYMNKKIAATSNGNKVAQIAQRFNQMINHDATLLDEVKKRGTVVVHRSGGCIFKIKEEKIDNKLKRVQDDASITLDDTSSSLNVGKNSTRKKNSIRKRPSIRILVESPRKDRKIGNVFMKKQMYEINIVNKETIVLKPRVPDKSERVLEKTKELKHKKMNVMLKTNETEILPLTAIGEIKTEEPSLVTPKRNNLKKIYDKFSFRSTFLYGRKDSTKLESEPNQLIDSEKSENHANDNNCFEKVKEVSDETIVDSSNAETSSIHQDPEFKPIDFNLNLFFQDENLSTKLKYLSDEENVNCQGRDDVTTVDECKPDVKPNSSFLFRTQPIGKLENVCSNFLQDMLSFDSKIDSDLIKTTTDDENNYEVIGKNICNNEKEVEENIYQSLCEATGDTASVKSYESFENYDEIAQNILDNKIDFSDLLEYKSESLLSEKAPDPPPPRKNTVPRISSPILTSTTSNFIQQDMQKPKLPNSRSDISMAAYEKNHYLKLPAHQDTYESIIDTTNNVENISLKSAQAISLSENCESETFNDISENPYKNSKNDTMSIISNCYESISMKQNYSTINQILRHAISTTTLTSEHRINSIYGTMIGQSLTPPSDSDEWDDEDVTNITDDRFIVFCKKTKSHKSPDWSRLVRQKLDEWNDDSDHLYESLYSIQQQQASQGETKEETASKNINLEKVQEDIDNYDSFDESDEEANGQKSTLDVNNIKLPEPPQSTGQVYALVQRIKNFGSISKNEISKGISKIAKKRTSLSRLPTSRSQFYENSQIEEQPTYVAPKYESKSLGKKSRGLSKLQKLGRLTINKLPSNFSLNEPYVQPEDQTSCAITKKVESGSSPKLSCLIDDFKTLGCDIDRQDSKTKDDESLNKKMRKGTVPLVGSSSSPKMYGSLRKNSTFYVIDSIDVDSGIFAINEKITNSPENSSFNISSNSSLSIPNDLKRRSVSSIGSRPNDPPPPPPPESRSRKLGGTSWYAECGLFKSESIVDDENSVIDEKASSSWYTESGLYQTSNSSVISSSGSSGVSTGGECSPCGEENSHSMFLNEPLYQLYTAAKLESISSNEFDPEVESDGYEEISKNEILETIAEVKTARPSALQLIEPNQGPSRTLWSEVPEVIQSGILSKLSQNEKRLQEAKFEILTSEASYLKSLNLLRSHFMNHPAFRDPQILDPSDRKTLFSYISPVLDCSDRLLSDLESCWQDNIMLINLSKAIYKHAEKHFKVYILYCEHQGKLDRTLKRLKETNAAFKEALELLENDSVCCGLNLHSFLMLPMQRITRLPLLIDAAMTKLKSNDEEFNDWKITLAILNKIVSQCNQAANRCEQAFEMEVLSKQIEFPTNINPFPLIPFNTSSNSRLSRTLVRRGELVHIIYRGDDAKLTFGKKSTIKKNIYCFLFTDIIVLTKKKSDESFLVFDYCQRSLLQLSSGDAIPQLPTKELNQAGKYIIFMSLLENCIGKPLDLILSCPSETERQRWLQVTAPPTTENPYETLYEQWDCPQVAIRHPYQSLEPDELTLDAGDIVNVFRKMKDDGWYFGERTRDGLQGWFPGNYAEEVHSAHVRARNLKQRHRLLLYTANYLEAQKDVVAKKK